MYAKARQDEILEILKKHGYVTVDYLTKKLHYSTATINRDLNLLQKQNLIKRSYGGAELAERHSTPLPYRYQLMRVEKRKIGKAAAEQVCDGDVLFIDGSTTTQSMAAFLIDFKDIKVITNNMTLAAVLSEHGIKTVCLGGAVIEPPSILYGDETVLNAAAYRADKMFFATGGISSTGMLNDTVYAMLLRTMAQNSDKIYYLADHNKIDVKADKYFFDLSRIDCVISDYEFPEETKKRFSDTEFIKV